MSKDRNNRNLKNLGYCFLTSVYNLKVSRPQEVWVCVNTGHES